MDQILGVRQDSPLSYGCIDSRMHGFEDGICDKNILHDAVSKNICCSCFEAVFLSDFKLNSRVSVPRVVVHC